MGVMKDIIIELDEMCIDQAYNEWTIVQNHINDSKADLTVELKDQIQEKLNKYGLYLDEVMIDDMVESAIYSTYEV